MAALDAQGSSRKERGIKEMRADRVIQRLCPNSYLWLYYNFSREYAREPVDMEDFIDGLSCIRAKQEIEEIYNGKSD